MHQPHVTITFTRYNEPDWLVDEALDALARQFVQSTAVGWPSLPRLTPDPFSNRNALIVSKRKHRNDRRNT